MAAWFEMDQEQRCALPPDVRTLGFQRYGQLTRLQRRPLNGHGSIPEEPPATHGPEVPLIDILRELAAPDFTEACVPEPIFRVADAFSKATGFDRNGVIGAATAVAAAATDDRVRLLVRRESDWIESARLWVVIIGSPSDGKSPSIRVTSDPMKELHKELFARWLAENPDPDAKDAAPRPAVYTSDATVEKLSDLLQNNPRGLLMIQEEFASWIGGIDAYKGDGNAKGRGDWLQLYDGGAHQVDRVKRGSVLVLNWSCSVLAAATRATLTSNLRQLPEDGLIHRFIPIIVRRPGAESDFDAKPALDAWARLVREIFVSTTCDSWSLRHRISVNAQILFDRERAEIRQAIDALADLSPALASHLGKHAGMIARIALAFHVVDRRPGDAIEADTMQRAIAFMRIVRRHAAVLFLHILSQSPALELARSVARTLLAEKVSEVGRHTFTQHCRQWRGAPEWHQRQAVQLLEDAGWLTADPTSRAYGGWAASRWFVHPEVHIRFAEHGEAQRKRRRHIKAALTGSDDA